MTHDEAVANMAMLIRQLDAEGAIKATGTVVATTTIDDLGLDSIGKLTLIQAAEARFSVEIPLGSLEGVSSVGALADLVVSLLEAR
jgi:acyl carrier protein